MFTTAFLDIPPLRAQRHRALPGSKSISNRVLLLAALSRGHDHRARPARLRRHPRHAGRPAPWAARSTQQATTCAIDGLAGRLQVRHADLFMGNAGTAMRPLTAALAVLGRRLLRCVACRACTSAPSATWSMRCASSAATSTTSATRAFRRCASARRRVVPALDAPIRVRGDVSSQFLTALLLALPLVRAQRVVNRGRGRTDLQALHRDHAQPAGALRHPDAARGWQRFTIPAGSRYQSPGEIHVEADASSASYFIALGAMARRAEAPSAHRGRRARTPSRATSASSTPPGRWARRSPAGPNGSKSAAAAGR